MLVFMKSIDSNWFYTVASVAAVGSLVSCQQSKEPQRPNIVYIMTDVRYPLHRDTQS